MASEITDVGNWIKIGVLGCGGFGSVTLWKKKLNGDIIALKTLHLHIKSQYIERWADEVASMLKLNHTNIVKAIPTPEELFCLSPGLPILSMEYCEQGDLRKVLMRPEYCSGLPEVMVRKVLQNVKDGIEYLHRENIIHRDLKPENIVLKEINNEVIFKLIDLGYTKELNRNSLCSSFVGTLQYVAPELFTTVYSKSVDYWSFGFVCHEIITGVRPFLPNMTPYSWMPLVKKKTFDDVCIYQNEDETIEYSTQLSSECYISQSLRCDVEAWLRLALEWDPSRRGRCPQGGHLIIFSQLQSILEKKMITVFSSVTLEVVSYEVDGSTALTTLKDWIKRDTKMSTEDQLLLLPSGEPLPSQGLAAHYWDPAAEIAMVYVLDKNGLELCNIPPRIPHIVKNMLENPRKPQKYYFLRRSWTSSIYFLKVEVLRCQAFLESYAVKVLSIIMENQKVKSLDAVINNDLQQVIGFMKLLNDSLDYDIKCWNSVGLTVQDVPGPEDWKKESDIYNVEISQLGQVAHKLGHKINVTSNHLATLQNYLDTVEHPLEQIKKILETAYELYNTLQKRPKEVKGVAVESVDLSMVNVINTFLATREAFFTDRFLQKHLQEVKKCENEVLSIVTPLKALHQHVCRVKRSLRKSQLQRQKNIWQLLVDFKQRPMMESFADNITPNNVDSNVQNKDEDKPQIIFQCALSKRQSFNEDLSLSENTRSLMLTNNFNSLNNCT